MGCRRGTPAGATPALGRKHTAVTETDEDADALLPRQTSVLFSHTEAEAALLESYRQGRIPHAWLIGGPPGIGKATLAYRLARFVLVHPDPNAPDVKSAKS